MTRQRQEIYDHLLSDRSHPTASDIYDKAHSAGSDISLATVYNCLEALVQHGAVRQVNFDREPSRYCANLVDHGHFHDQATGQIHDVVFKEGVKLTDLLDLPEGVEVCDLEITLRGRFPATESSQF